MANTENKKLSGFALWWQKRSIKSAAIKEVKERYKREELERKNQLNKLKKQDKAMYNEALKQEKAKSFLRKAGLSCMLKRAEKQAVQKMADQGLTLTKSEEMTRTAPIKYSDNELKAIAQVEVEAEINTANKPIFRKEAAEHAYSSRQYKSMISTMPKSQSYPQKIMDDTFKSQDRLLEEVLQFVEKNQMYLDVYEEKVRLGLEEPNEERQSKLKDNVARANEKYRASVNEMIDDLENLKDGMFATEGVDGSHVGNIADFRKVNLQTNMLGFPAVATKMADTSSKYDIPNNIMYGQACKKGTEKCEQLLNEQKDAAISQRTTLLQKDQRKQELTFKEKKLSQKLTPQENMELVELESNTEINNYRMKYSFIDSKTLKELEQSRAAQQPPKQLDLKEFISKEKKQPEKTVEEKQQTLEEKKIEAKEVEELDLEK